MAKIADYCNSHLNPLNKKLGKLSSICLHWWNWLWQFNSVTSSHYFIRA